MFSAAKFHFALLNDPPNRQSRLIRFIMKGHCPFIASPFTPTGFAHLFQIAFPAKMEYDKSSSLSLVQRRSP